MTCCGVGYGCGVVRGNIDVGVGAFPLEGLVHTWTECYQLSKIRLEEHTDTGTPF